ncbi:hypothetical protein QBC32DRAFT_209650 [Pseudoneurospora amorphoporcata]|uniref:Proteophosphoglycan 5 n=1 Tax=Pseudoneurospora amorphoporcata TaxID=241081 RepID=A0AAN6P0Q8_9PEZI|nr:hypothetical protein QBC32DRAFT_209650 [Pseudoneurospora amorphoporcata]
MRKAITVNPSIANSNSIISRTVAPEITAATARQSATAVSSGSDRIPFSHVPISVSSLLQSHPRSSPSVCLASSHTRFISSFEQKTKSKLDCIVRCLHIMQRQQQQDQPGPLPKATPGRRRNNRHSSNTIAPRRTYASENDMPSEGPYPINFGPPAPFTPHKPGTKSGTNSPAPDPQANGSRPKPRSTKSSRSTKQVSSTSPASTPAPARNYRTSPPQTAALPKSVFPPAFAGGSFHASPAPSALPIPSFLAKSMDSPSVKDTGRANSEPSPPATDSEAPTPRTRFPASDISREESPLDFFFRADRAEKERARSGSLANVYAHSTSLFSPQGQGPSSQEPRTLPTGTNLHGARLHHHSEPAQPNYSMGFSSSELGGNQGRSMGPAFSRPYQERIRDARSSEGHPGVASSVPRQQQQQQQQEPNMDPSEKLKRFLAIPAVRESQLANQPPSHPASQHSFPGPHLRGGELHGNQPLPPASFPQAVDQHRSPDIQSMEDSLRRILKLDSRVNLGTSATNYQSS